MGVIYVPKGKAFEYSPLACNLYTGCPHGCKYCYAPGVMRKKKAVFHSNVLPRENIIVRLERDCQKMAGDTREVLFCFGCDPYPENSITTRDALIQLEAYGMKANILTKGGKKAIRDFDLLKHNGWAFGTSLSFASEKLREEWEPNASTIADRISTIENAIERGIKTWISIEPIMDMDSAFEVMYWARGTVDHIKVGKLNHMYFKNKSMDWKQFVKKTREILNGYDYYIKKDTLEAAGLEG